MDLSDRLSDKEILRLVSLKELFSGFTHEIAQPLNAIMIASQVLQLRVQRGIVSEDEKSFLINRLGIVAAQVQRATQLVDSLRSFSRKKSSEGRADLKGCFESVYSLMGQQFVGRGFELSWQCVDPLLKSIADSQSIELILVQALAYARDSVEAIGEWHDTNEIPYVKSVKVRLYPSPKRSAVGIFWNGGNMTGAEDMNPPESSVGLAVAESVLKSLGGNLSAHGTSISIVFP
jgi:nitrogen fixation/metabolism regulation signal transduction histidine kinase